MKLEDRNLVRPITPPGAAAIAVVRVTGPAVAAFLAARFSQPVTPLRCVHGELRDESGSVIDDAVVVLHDDQRTADLNVHGGSWVVESVIRVAQSSGFIHLPMHFLPPLLLDCARDADTLLKREVAMAAPMAKTEQGLRVLLNQPKAWRELLRDSQMSGATWRIVIERILADRTLDLLLRPARVVILGPPNVGKSTLANRLFGQERSITADVPGTTRDWVGELANIDGLPVMLYDTPGIHETPDAIEREAIEKSRKILEYAQLVLVVREPFEQSPGSSLGPLHCRKITVVNKSDLLEAQGMDMGLLACFTTATTGKGMDELRTTIRRVLGCDDLDPQRPRIWAQRHRDILRRALNDSRVLSEMLCE